MSIQINQRLLLLRNVMSKNGIHAVIIPSSDPHQSEYVADHWQERAWISGFTGSAGYAVVTLDHAGIWTDSRYYLQAELETKDSEFVLHKMPDQFASYYIDYLLQNLTPGQRVAINGWMFSKSEVSKIKTQFDKKGIEVVYDIDLVSEIWPERPSLLNSQVELHNSLYTGMDVNTKLENIRGKMKNIGASHHFISALDDIAWTLNIRGKDVEYNPVNIAYLIISLDNSHLFIDNQKITKEAEKSLQEAGITIHPYNKVIKFLSLLSDDEKMLVDPSICSQKVYDAISCIVIEGSSIPKGLKAIKTETEIKNIKNAMIKDAAALANTFYDLEQTLYQNKELTELDLAQKLAYYRSQQPLYRGESFGAIVGYKGNGAIIHYHPEKKTCKTIKREGILLVDSGGQYLDGTTDITRTFTLDKPSDEEKVAYTLILKGMIALSKAVFPKGTMGIQLDTLARQFLWSQGLNYGHGTGHGVGFYLNVHEPPQGFTPGLSERGKTIIEPGMLSSNEPGFYKENSFGMRIENLIVSRESEHKGFLCFETITLYPFEHHLIDVSLLTKEEISWIDKYHKSVYDNTEPLLSPEVKIWFKEKCKEISN